MSKLEVKYLEGLAELNKMAYKVNNRSFLAHAQVHENKCTSFHRNNRKIRDVINIFIDLKPKVGGRIWRFVTRKF
jgi:hypothetical protein